MKLTSARVERAESQVEAQAIPDTHPAVPQLSKLFGNHTFFLDGEGLSIVEPVEPAPTDGETGKVVKLASWGDATRTSLTPHEPEPTDVMIALGSEDPASAA
jgi:hypothetical protein